MDHVVSLSAALYNPVRGDPVLTALGQRLKQGDETAIEPFIRTLQDGAFKLAWNMLHDYHAAQDVVQEAFLTALSEVRSLREPSALKPWFMRIVSNRSIASMRRARPNTIAELPDDLASDEALAETSGTKLAVRQALASLSPTDRSIILMRDYLEMPYDELATALRLPLGTVKSRLCEARRRLAKRLMNEEGTP